jgi:hypothetical protein
MGNRSAYHIGTHSHVAHFEGFEHTHINGKHCCFM